MTVRKNIGYPLRTRRVNKDQAKQWIDETADLVDCGSLLDRFPGQLSGGQQQRVALARALVARPDVVLFDEPLSNLDARLRDQVRAQIHELHGQLHFTAVFVTHDQAEALALGDRMAIMKAGKIEQFDTPEHVFERPATEYVAAFIGMANRLELERRDGGWRCFGEPVAGNLPELRDAPAAVAARLRPEDLMLSPVEEAPRPETAGIPAQIVDSEFGGRHMDVVVAVGEARLQARVPSGQLGGWARTLKQDQTVTMSFRPSDAMYYDDAGDRVAGTVRVETAAPVVA
jgi:iron(III) transport system ATP-binding protein